MSNVNWEPNDLQSMSTGGPQEIMTNASRFALYAVENGYDIDYAIGVTQQNIIILDNIKTLYEAGIDDDNSIVINEYLESIKTLNALNGVLSFLMLAKTTADELNRR